ncbi:zinc-binding dehydrogenase [Burkholderia sp. 3C]
MSEQCVHAHAVVEYGAPLVHQQTALPVPQGKEVLVRVLACGLCHTDIHVHEGHFDLGGGNKLPLDAIGIHPPVVMGHEPFGRIVGFGPDSGLRPVDIGREVIVYPWLGCGTCEACESGDDQMCVTPDVIGMQRPGGHGDHVIVREARFLVDATGVDPVLAGSYACSGLTSYAALKKLDIDKRKWIGIIGVGGVGLMAVAIAKAVGFQNVVAIDISDEKLQMSVEQYGASLAINTRSPDALAKLQEATGGLSGIIDFVGSNDTAAFAVSALKASGRLVVVGLFGGEITASIPLVAIKQLQIKGSLTGNIAELNELMEYVRAGSVKSIPAHAVPIDRVNEAMAELKSGKVSGRIVLTHPEHA